MDEQIKNLLEAAVRETGIDLRKSASELAVFTAQQAAELSAVVGLPGYDQAAIAARDAIALEGGLDITDTADAAAQRVIGVIQGSLMLAAQLLVPGAGGTA